VGASAGNPFLLLALDTIMSGTVQSDHCTCGHANPSNVKGQRWCPLVLQQVPPGLIPNRQEHGRITNAPTVPGVETKPHITSSVKGKHPNSVYLTGVRSCLRQQSLPIKMAISELLWVSLCLLAAVQITPH
jgi:hypothetical protein